MVKMHYYSPSTLTTLSETAHLPPMADLAYRRPLDLYYKNEAPPTNRNGLRIGSVLDTEDRIHWVRTASILCGKGLASRVFEELTCDSVIAKYQKRLPKQRNGKEHKAETQVKPKSVQTG